MSGENLKCHPRVAVLLAAYNGEQWISDQINTILMQKDVYIDLFVSVDVSTDKTFILLKKHQLSSPNIIILPYGQKFGGAARNFFRLIRDVDFSKYDYVAFSDQDDLWLPQKLAYAINKIKDNDLDAYSSDVIAFWKNGNTKLIKKSYSFKKYDYLFESAGPGCSYVFKSHALGLFKAFIDINWNSVKKISLHDWLVYSYFRSNGLKWYIDGIPLIYYRQHSSNQFGINSGLKAFLTRIQKIKNKWFRNEVENICKLLNVNVPSKIFMLKNFYQLRRRPRDVIMLLCFVVFRLY